MTQIAKDIDDIDFKKTLVIIKLPIRNTAPLVRNTAPLESLFGRICKREGKNR